MILLILHVKPPIKNLNFFFYPMQVELAFFLSFFFCIVLVLVGGKGINITSSMQVELFTCILSLRLITNHISIYSACPYIFPNNPYPNSSLAYSFFHLTLILFHLSSKLHRHYFCSHHIQTISMYYLLFS